jgi:hypothetical protein
MFKEFKNQIELYSKIFHCLNYLEMENPTCIDKAFAIFEKGLDPFQFTVYYSAHDIEKVRMFTEVIEIAIRGGNLILSYKKSNTRVDKFIWQDNDWVFMRRSNR